MDVDSKIIAALIGLAGILLGAFISSLSYFFKLRNEARKTVRKVLYYLLEIHYAISCYRVQIDGVAERWIEQAGKRLTEKWKVPPSPDQHAALREMIAAHMQNIVHAARSTIDQGLIEAYHSALLEMAQTHPILAFQLRGKERLEVAIAVTENYQKVVVEKLIKPIEDQEIASALLKTGNSFKNKAYEEALGVLEQSIKRLAWNSGLSDYMRCFFILRYTKRRQYNDAEALDDLVDALAQMLINEITQKKTVSQVV